MSHYLQDPRLSFYVSKLVRPPMASLPLTIATHDFSVDGSSYVWNVPVGQLVALRQVIISVHEDTQTFPATLLIEVDEWNEPAEGQPLEQMWTTVASASSMSDLFAGAESVEVFQVKNVASVHFENVYRFIRQAGETPVVFDDGYLRRTLRVRSEGDVTIPGGYLRLAFRGWTVKKSLLFPKASEAM